MYTTCSMDILSSYSTRLTYIRGFVCTAYGCIKAWLYRAWRKYDLRLLYAQINDSISAYLETAVNSLPTAVAC